MTEEVYYRDARNSIINFFEFEFPDSNKKFLSKILHSFYGLCHYEEEGDKIRPSIIITNNINSVVKSIPSTYKIAIHKDETDSFFDQRMKSLMCFCKQDWLLYINYTQDGVEYGLVKTINSIKEKTIKQLLFQEKTKSLIKGYVVNIDVISSSQIVLKGIKGSNTVINFDVKSSNEENWEDVISRFAENCTTKLKTTAKKKDEVTLLFKNIFIKAFKNLHGTICLIVDKDFADVKGTLSDGVWLTEPIQLSKLFLQTNSYNESKLNSFADVFVRMLDYDGVTIVDNAGRIRAYNVFISTNLKLNKTFVGGARKRATQTLLESQNKKYVGVYMQSQEGDNLFDFCKGYKGRATKKVDSKQEEHQITLSEIEGNK